MADVPVLEPAEGQEVAEKPPAGKKKFLLMAIIAAVVLVGGGVGGWLFMSSGSDKEKKHAVEKPKKEPAAPAVYLALEPPFVVNFEAEQTVRFLQIAAQVMSRDPATIELVKANDPAVRNDLLMLFGNQKYEVVSTREGKEQLRTDALNVVRKVVEESGGKPDHVEAIYFTSFVMQ
ncbi:MAG TPA: flagellar basal body-associated FliL family protein [Steroidobacteraceae bacterium]|nr:flagellar basal body-associated FliL family protein [Steroidobacteraceae bacterium]